MVSKGGERRELASWGEIGREAGHHGGHVMKVEASRGSGRETVVVHREVAVAVSIRTGGRYMRWIQDVGVD